MLINTSILPRELIPSCTISEHLSGSETSPNTICVFTPNSAHEAATSSNSFLLDRVFNIKSDPSLANVSAICLPIFRLAPVIIVVLPSKRI